MAKKEVTVVINGEEHVSKAAGDATAGLELFGKKIPFVLDVTKLLEIGLDALRAAFATAKEFALDSIRAYDEYAASNQRLSAQSKLTGVSVGTLREAAKNAREEFNLGIAVANDAAITTAKYASRAGDATKQNELLASALNLGAASGLTAAESMEALEQGLRGQDEGFDKLLGKNPSTIWKEYADANGLAVGKMTDAQKRMAELTAVVDAGNKVGDVYNERLQTGAGQQEVMNNKIENAKIAFGAAIQPIRILIVQGLSKLIDVGTPLVITLGKVATFLFETFVGSFKAVQSAVGSVIEVVGKLTGSKSLEEWGKRQSQALPEFIAQIGKLENATKESTDATAAHGKAHELAAVKITASADATEKASKKSSAAVTAQGNTTRQALGETLAAQIGLTTSAIERLTETAENTLQPLKAKDFADQMARLKLEAAGAGERLAALSPPMSLSTRIAIELSENVVGVARGALDAAQAFGVLDRTSASALNSVINIGAGLGKLAGGDFSGLPQLLGGVANVISTLVGGDGARRALLKENSAALSKLSKDVGALKLNITGEDFQKVTQALGGISFKGGSKNLGSDIATLSTRLDSAGLSIPELQRIAQSVGASIFDKNGTIQFDAITQLAASFSNLAPGRLSSSFADQFDFFKQGQGLDNVTGLSKVGGILDFLRNVGGVTALGGVDLSDPTKARATLRGLVEQFNNGTGVSGLGKVTGSQLMDILVSLIGEIDNAAGTSSVVSAGDVSFPTSSLTSTASAAADSVAGILMGHTELQSRIAEATEGSWRELQLHTGLLRDLISVSSGSVDRINAALESDRFALRIQQGIGAQY